MVNVEVGNPVFNAYHLFMQTADAVQKYADSTFYRRSGLSVSKFGVLQILAIREGSMTPSEIAERVFREKNSITAVINTLEREGVVRREPSADDRRSVKVVITDKGWKEANRLNPIAQEISREALSCMDKEQLETLVDTMREVRESLLPIIARSSGK